MNTVPKSIVLACGGTGGHIYPALAIAEAFRERFPQVNIHFAGAKGGMENRIVPQAGFSITPLWISGFYRPLNLRNLWRNLSLPAKLITSRRQARALLQDHRPDIVIGTGGYASFPVLRAANGPKFFTVLQEQNAQPGLANRRLAAAADLICLGNAAASKHFPEEKTVYTGNPVRSSILQGDARAFRQKYNLKEHLPTALLTGGSLGAASLNRAIETHLQQLAEAPLQLVWQCGKIYYQSLKNHLQLPDNVRLLPYLEHMPDAYAIADLVIARAGAITLAELEALRLPAILVPSPNVTDDHQTKNAKSLVADQVARLVKDRDAEAHLVPQLLELVQDPAALKTMRTQWEQRPTPLGTKLMVDKMLEEWEKFRKL